jgi:ABC-type glutathione transport system ATPase component
MEMRVADRARGDAPSGGDPLIDLRDVVKTYQTGAGGVTVLQDVSFKMHSGEFASIVGPSESGNRWADVYGRDERG